jgi:hypothetical protein
MVIIECYKLLYDGNLSTSVTVALASPSCKKKKKTGAKITEARQFPLYNNF